MVGVIFLLLVILNLFLYKTLIRNRDYKLRVYQRQLTRRDRQIKELQQTINRMREQPCQELE